VNEDEAPQPAESAEVLARWYLTPEDLGQASTTGELALVSLGRAFGGRGRRYDIDELAGVIGADSSSLLLLWRSLGFTDPRPGEQVLSDSDLRMLNGVIPFLSENGFSDEMALQVTRVIGSSMARIASAQVDSIVTTFDSRGEPGSEAGPAPGERPADTVTDDQSLADDTARLLGAMPDVLEFVWRRHLLNAAQRRLLRFGAGETTMCVGFADLVGFTAHSQQLTARELAAVVERFEQLAYDVVATHGGRVVKMIGDEVLFVADEVATAARIALDLSEAHRDDEALLDVRVGLAAGSVLEREGDVFGPVVNLAHRIVTVAFPGSVVVSSEVADALTDDDEVLVRSISSQPLKDIGKVALWTLRPAASPEHPARTRRARHHLRDRQALVSERRAARQRMALERSRELAEESGHDEVIELVGDLVRDDAADETTAQIEAITEAVLAADIDPELQVGLLADIDAVLRLHRLEDEAAGRAEEADLEAEDRIRAVESEARVQVERIEAEARERIAAVLAEAERRVERLNEEADRKVERVAAEVGREADRAEREAERRARWRTIRSVLTRRRRNDD
jgi:adenylate cyclase